MAGAARLRSGARDLIESPTLSNLVELTLTGNGIRTGVLRLADPAVMPRLGRCALHSNLIAPGTATRLRRRPALQV